MENKVIGVRFTKLGKLTYLLPTDENFKIGDTVIGISERGEELARVVCIKDLEEVKKEVGELAKIIRKATREDIKKNSQLKEKAENALIICKKMAKELGLDMKLISAAYTFDETKLIFHFIADQRIDFRELVKKLAAEFRLRIELRQIGARDEIKEYSTLGVSVRELCCGTFLPDFETVTIKMAKEQGLQINMPKISGCCGKLMCCLKYEEDVYKEKLKNMPRVGEIVKYNEESAKVVSMDVLGQKLKLKIGEPGEERFEFVELNNIKRITKKEMPKSEEKKGSE